MVKFYVKNTNQEVKIGDRINVKIPMKTPYGEGNCEVETLITQASLEQLCKDGIIEKKNTSVADFALYKPYIRRLARKMELSFEDTIEFLDTVHSVSIPAHNALLLDLMAEVMNRDKEIGKYVYTILPRSGVIKEPFIIPHDEPIFATEEDAKKAVSLISPFMKHGL